MQFSTIHCADIVYLKWFESTTVPIQWFDNMISFPFHVWMSEKQFEYLKNSLIKSLIYLRKK